MRQVGNNYAFGDMGLADIERLANVAWSSLLNGATTVKELALMQGWRRHEAWTLIWNLRERGIVSCEGQLQGDTKLVARSWQPTAKGSVPLP